MYVNVLYYRKHFGLIYSAVVLDNIAF